MFKKIVLIQVVTSLSCLSVAAAQSPVDFSSPDKPMVVTAKHPYFTLRLRSNRTTGFSWYLADYDHLFLKPLNETYQPPNAKLVGAPGEVLWQFQVGETAFQVPHLLKITFTYARPWTTDGESSTTFSVITQK